MVRRRIGSQSFWGEKLPRVIVTSAQHQQTRLLLKIRGRRGCVGAEGRRQGKGWRGEGMRGC